MPFETHPHVVAVAIFTLALFAVLVVKKLRDPSSVWTLVLGVLLVGLGAWSLNGFDIMKTFYEVLHEKNNIGDEQFQQARNATNVWALILPAVVAAIGANLISSWAVFRNH
jgi:uncharacterized membrane protein